MSFNETRNAAGRPVEDQAASYDAIVIGAGIAGLNQLYKLRALGLRVLVLEAGTGVGGAWYWNRYPGARFDSESYSYAFSFSPEIMAEWDWSEHFAAQPETLRYLNFVADRLDLRRHIEFKTLVTSAVFDEDAHRWSVKTEAGAQYRSRYLTTSLGPLTVPTLPRIEGIDRFKGQAFHTARWPREDVTFAGKRVAVIGTGATGVQTIQEVAKTASTLTVFQRTPNYCVPLNNSPITAEEQPALKTGYAEMFARCNQTLAWFLHTPDPRSALEVTPEDREAFFESRYSKPGMGLWQGNFSDITTNQEANDLISEFVRRKIRERVKDPVTAAKLVPTDHGFGTRRVPLETSYYEVYNQPNVTLIDLKATPIRCITATGITTAEQEFTFDIIIYATGFDAITGSFDRIDLRGVGGERLKEKWADGPKTFLGLVTSGFPNMFMPAGPLSAQGNIPRAIEEHAAWIAGLIGFMEKHGYTYADVSQEAEARWTRHAQDVGADILTNQVDSWFTGVNTNIEGKNKRFIAQYRGGASTFRRWCEETAASGYACFTLK